MKDKFIILLLCIILLTSCSPREKSITVSTSDIKLIIWDPESFLQLEPLSDITSELGDIFPSPVIIHGRPSVNTTNIIENEFNNMPEQSICIFFIISGKPMFQISSEWNLWMPELWRGLDCRGKILIADAPWADEYLNPLKTAKADPIWAINGRIGYLRKKLPDSLLAASCRFDEVNILSRGLGSEKKLPLFTWYFFENLNDGILDSKIEIDLVELIEKTAELTAKARERGIVSDLEETLFFNQSEIRREEFRTFPNPVIWNGLADQLLLRKDQ